MIGEIIVKYWLEFLLGLISSGLIILCRYFYKLYKKERDKKKSETQQKIISEVKTIINDYNTEVVKLIQEEEVASKQADSQAEKKMQKISDELDILKKGVLSIQGKQFKDECRDLLEDHHHITLDEYQNISNEHAVYNKLEGNHEGDELFRLVGVKYNS